MASSLRCWHQPVLVSQEAAEREIEFRLRAAAAALRRHGQPMGCLFIHTARAFRSASAWKGEFKHPRVCRWKCDEPRGGEEHGLFIRR